MGYKDLKKDELKELCIKKGLSTAGKREDLITRLTQAESKEPIPDIFSQVSKPENSLQIKAHDNRQSNYPLLHIKSANLSNYFNFGYVYPLCLEESEIYKTENRANDILSQCPNYILASYYPINSFGNNDVLVEFIHDNLDYQEINSFEVLIVNQPFPVSRIKSIYFKTEKDRSTFISSVRTFPDNYVPESICKVFTSESKTIQIDFEKLPPFDNKSVEKWKEPLDFFDRLMGLFAFIKNTGLLYAEKENRLDEYLPSFFGALGLINSVPELTRFKENALLRPLFKELEITTAQRLLFKLVVDRIKANDTFSIKIAITLLESTLSETNKPEEKAELTEIIRLFKEVDKLSISFPELLTRDLISRNYPVLILLFLAKYPNKSRLNTDKQAVRTLFVGETPLPISTAEYVLSLLGFYYGYKNMIKADTNLRFNDGYYQTVANYVQSIKFKLDEFIDRFIIESCFNYAITQKQLSDNYQYLLQSNLSTKVPTNAPTNHFTYSTKLTEVLNHNVISITRISKLESAISEILAFYPDKVQKTSYLSAFFFNHFKLDLHYIIETIRKSPGDVNIDEVIKIIDLDKSKR